MSVDDHPNGTCGMFCPYCKTGVPRNREAVEAAMAAALDDEPVPLRANPALMSRGTHLAGVGWVLEVPPSRAWVWIRGRLRKVVHLKNR